MNADEPCELCQGTGWITIGGSDGYVYEVICTECLGPDDAIGAPF